jgi:hypothetical protein
VHGSSSDPWAKEIPSNVSAAAASTADNSDENLLVIDSTEAILALGVRFKHGICEDAKEDSEVCKIEFSSTAKDFFSNVTDLLDGEELVTLGGRGGFEALVLWLLALDAADMDIMYEESSYEAF